LISAIYRRNFKPQIFTDITTPVKQSYSPNTGKKAQVWKSTNFDAGLYDITGFLRALIFSIYLYFVDILVPGKKSQVLSFDFL